MRLNLFALVEGIKCPPLFLSMLLLFAQKALLVEELAANCSFKGTNNYIRKWFESCNYMQLMRFARPSTDGKSQNVLLVSLCLLCWQELPTRLKLLDLGSWATPRVFLRACADLPYETLNGGHEQSPHDIHWYPMNPRREMRQKTFHALLRRKLLCSSRA